MITETDNHFLRGAGSLCSRKGGIARWLSCGFGRRNRQVRVEEVAGGHFVEK